MLAFFLLTLICDIQVKTPSENLPLTVRVPQTEDEQRVGLSLDKSIATNQGMLFVYPKEDFYFFTMRKTAIPLTLFFFDQHKNLIEAHSASAHQYKLITSSKPAQYILEAHPDLLRDCPLDEISFDFLKKNLDE